MVLPDCTWCEKKFKFDKENNRNDYISWPELSFCENGLSDCSEVLLTNDRTQIGTTLPNERIALCATTQRCNNVDNKILIAEQIGRVRAWTHFSNRKKSGAQNWHRSSHHKIVVQTGLHCGSNAVSAISRVDKLNHKYSHNFYQSLMCIRCHVSHGSWRPRSINTRYRTSYINWLRRGECCCWWCCHRSSCLLRRFSSINLLLLLYVIHSNADDSTWLSDGYVDCGCGWLASKLVKRHASTCPLLVNKFHRRRRSLPVAYFYLHFVRIPRLM